MPIKGKIISRPTNVISRIDLTARSGAERVVVFVYKSGRSHMFIPEYPMLMKIRDHLETQNVKIAISPTAMSLIWKIEDNGEDPEMEKLLKELQEEKDERHSGHA